MNLHEAPESENRMKLRDSRVMEFQLATPMGTDARMDGQISFLPPWDPSPWVSRVSSGKYQLFPASRKY